jgi:hypothetical protein
VDPAAGAWLPNEFGDGVGETLGQVVDDGATGSRTEEVALGSAWRDVMLYSSLISLFGRADNVEPSRIATTRE